MDSATYNTLIGLTLSALGGAVILLHRDMSKRITKLERQQRACLSLLTRMALKAGIDERVLEDIQKAILV